MGDQPVIDQRQPIPQRLEPLQKGHLLRRVELIECARVDRFHEVTDVVIELIENHIQPGALGAFVGRKVPELHAFILLEQMFDIKRFPMRNSCH